MGEFCIWKKIIGYLVNSSWSIALLAKLWNPYFLSKSCAIAGSIRGAINNQTRFVSQQASNGATWYNTTSKVIKSNFDFCQTPLIYNELAWSAQDWPIKNFRFEMGEIDYNNVLALAVDKVLKILFFWT